MADAKPYETLDMDREIAGQEKPSAYFEQFIYSLQVLIYEGNPENNVSAAPTTFCMNPSGAAGAILYVKQTGTGNTGWVNVA